MITIKEAAKKYRKDWFSDGSNLERCSDLSFRAGVVFAQDWIPINELKPEGIPLLFKGGNENYSVGKFEFISGKLCIITDIGYSLLEDSVFTHFRPIEYK